MDRESFINVFKNIQSMGWVNSHRHGDTGIGKTLEDLMQIDENNHQTYDLHGYEIKAHRDISNSNITLFTKSPTHPRCANTILRTNFGVQENNDNSRVLHTSIYAGEFNSHRGGYSFKIEIEQNNNLTLYVRDSNNNIVSNDIQWNISHINNILENKIKYLALIKAEQRVYNNIEQFKYNSCILYSGITTDRFINSLRNQLICVELRLGYYRSGRNMNRTHDHGTGFRISQNDLQQLYPIVDNID